MNIVNKRRIIRFFLVVVSHLFVVNLYCQRIVDPQVLAQLEENRKKVEESGYADIEIDLLHEKMEKLLPQLKSLIKQDDKNKKYYLKMQIAFGESIKSISERYLYHGDVIIQTNANVTKIIEITFSFEKLNPLGNNFKLEKRELINPSPQFFANNEKLDRHEDMLLRYFERVDESTPYIEKNKFKIKSIKYFPKRVSLVNTYKKYLRRAKKKLVKKIYSMELTERVKVQRMLDFE